VNQILIDLFVHVFVLCMTVTLLMVTAKKTLEWIMEINDLLKGIRSQK